MHPKKQKKTKKKQKNVSDCREKNLVLQFSLKLFSLIKRLFSGLRQPPATERFFQMMKMLFSF